MERRISVRELIEGFHKHIQTGDQDSQNVFYKLRNAGQDYTSCFDDYFVTYTNVVDLSDFELGEYQVYSLKITNLSCVREITEVTVLYEEGDDLIEQVVIVLASSDSGSWALSQDPPGLNEERKYTILDSDLSDIGVSKNIVSATLALRVKGNTLLLNDEAVSC